MSQEHVEKVRRCNAAFNRGGLDAAFADFHGDFEWRDLQHAPDAPERRRGIAAVREVWKAWRDAFDPFGEERAQDLHLASVKRGTMTMSWPC